MLLFKKVLFIIALLAGASPALANMLNTHRALANRIVQNINKSNNPDRDHTNVRMLAISNSFFKDDICPAYIQGFKESAPDASCNCSSSRPWSIECKVPQVDCTNEAIAEFQGQGFERCPGDACGVTASITTFFAGSDTTLSITKLEIEREFEGLAYAAERTVVEELSCDLYLTLSDANGGGEYRCDSCNTCGGDGDQISLDCSNIQAGATTSGCVDADSTEDGIGIDLCPAVVTIPSSGFVASSAAPSLRSGLAAAGVTIAAGAWAFLSE